MKTKTRIALFGGGAILIAFLGFLNFIAPQLEEISYNSVNASGSYNTRQLAAAELNSSNDSSTTTAVTHIATPASVKAIYMTSWVAGTPSLRAKLLILLETKEVNAVVIDVKDYTGKISFTVNNPQLKAYGADTPRIADIDSLIATLHAHGIYVIGRIASFQDPYMVQHSPQLAVKSISTGKPWEDKKGIPWIDAGATPDWQYLALIAKEAYARGFDEVNYDYIRFPTDGNMADISYPYTASTTPKHVVIRNFFSYLHDALAKGGPNGEKIPFSVDIFGLTTVAQGDMGIGQEIDDALQYADYVSPMVYPSAFAAGSDGFSIPAEHPYDIISYSMGSAVTRAEALSKSLSLADTSSSSSIYSTAPTTASSTVSSDPTASKLRPWLQDFSLGTTYTPAMVRQQIQATYDVGISSWMLWNAGNNYSSSALLPK
jgi:hypothetical protein